MKKSLANVKIFYAMKANANHEILSIFKEQQCNVDVVSYGEIERALEVGFKPEQIIYSGVGKTKNELRNALKLDIHQINAESLEEIDRIESLARELNLKAKIVIRLNPNIDINTHPYIATGLKENKFGIEISKLDQIIEKFKSNPQNLLLKGVSLHLGSQMLEVESFRQALKLIKPHFIKLKSSLSSVDRFDIGGGLGIIYNYNQQSSYLEKEQQLLLQYSSVVKEELSDLIAAGVEIQSEPGRWLIAHAGVLLTEVQYIKSTDHKKFLILDSGMNHLMRPSLYQAHHEIFPLVQNKEQEKYDVVGPICESSDYFAKDRVLDKCQQGDFVVIADVGAYGYSMANIYNLHKLPLEIVI